VKKFINGVELAWEEAGAGLPVVLLHAFPLNRRMWALQVKELAGRYRVITPDFRGAGESAVADEDSTMERLAEDIAGLLDHLGLDRVVLGGLSMGGYATFAFLRRYAARVTALILADTRATADTDDGKKARHEMAALAEREGAAPVAQQMVPKLLGATTQERKRDVVASVQEIILSNPPAGIARFQRGMAVRPDSRPLLPAIECPTLVLVGEEDTLTPPTDADVLVSGIGRSRLVRIPEAGHLSNLENPPAFNRALNDFLSRLRL